MTFAKLSPMSVRCSECLPLSPTKRVLMGTHGIAFLPGFSFLMRMSIDMRMGSSDIPVPDTQHFAQALDKDDTEEVKTLHLTPNKLNFEGVFRPQVTMRLANWLVHPIPQQSALQPNPVIS